MSSRNSILVLMLFSAFFCCGNILLGQPSRFENKRLGAVRFSSNEQFLHPAELNSKLASLKTGQPLSLGDVQTAIERLYATGRFSDIEVDADTVGDDVELTFRVTPAAFIRNVTVPGVADPPNQGQLVNATKLSLGEQFTRAQTRQSTENLLEVLRTNGFYLAKVTPNILPAPYQQVDLTFHVDTGNRAKYSTPVVHGNPGKHIEDIIRATRWKRFYGLLGWKEVTDSRTTQGLDRLRRAYQKKNYLLAHITLDQMQYVESANVVVPTITADSGPEVLVRTRGAKISKSRLRDLIPIYQELTVDNDLLVEGKREIAEYMQSRGYFEADVRVDRSDDPGKSQQIIEYSIDPGERSKLVAIEIRGNRYFDTETIRERMYVTPATLIRFRRGRFSEAFLRRDLNAIRGLYQSNGFRDVRVNGHREDDYKGRQDEKAVVIDIREGEQTFVEQLILEGIDGQEAQEVRAFISSTEGQPFSDLNVATDQDSILTHFYDLGYPDAAFEATVNDTDTPNRVALKYTIRTGQRRYVRDVLVSGLKDTDIDLVLSRIRNLQAGLPLSQTSMIESQRRLYDLGIFARVDAAIQNQEGDTDYKYVLYRFEEARKWFLNGGFGAQIARIGRGSPTNFDSPAGAPGFSPRISLGVSRSNFLGLGHTLSLQTRLSNIQRRALLSYVAPQFKGNDNLNLTFTSLYDDSRDVQTFDSRRLEASAQLADRLSKANTIQYRLGYRRVSASNIKITPALVPLLSQPVQLAFGSVTFIQDRRDDPTDPRRGIWNTWDTTVAANPFGTQNSFSRTVGRNATYHRIRRDLLLARSTQFGVITKFTKDDVPLPERFFAGGAVSHRGFPDNQAGPRDALTGFPVGGGALLVNNLELRFPLIGENIGGVFFHDAGNVFSTLGKITFRSSQRDLKDFNYLVHALGFGIRYRTPIGPVRLDLAYSINPPRFMGLKGTTEQLLDPNLAGVQFVEQRISHFQFHFSLGQLF